MIKTKSIFKSKVAGTGLFVLIVSVIQLFNQQWEINGQVIMDGLQALAGMAVILWRLVTTQPATILGEPIPRQRPPGK